MRRTMDRASTQAGNNDHDSNTRNQRNDENENEDESLIKFSPSEMRLRMINELRKQEEIFSCVLELSQLEQSHAMQSASQVIQHYMVKHEMENQERNQREELIAQRAVYEVSLSQTVAESEINFMREKMINEEALVAAKNQIKQQELESKYSVTKLIEKKRSIFFIFHYLFCVISYIPSRLLIYSAISSFNVFSSHLFLDEYHLMSSYAGQVSDNLQHASDMLEIDRKLSLEKISHQEELLLQKQLECDRILREEKERENQLEGNRDSWRGSGSGRGGGRGRDFDEEEEEVEEETRYPRIADSDKKNQNQNYPSFKPSLAGNKKSSIRISENENEVEIPDDYEDNAESEVEIEVEDEYDNYSISFDLDRSRSRMSNDQKVSKLDRNKTKLDKIEKVEVGDRPYGKSVQYASFNSSVSVSSEMAMVQGRNASGPRSGISPRSGFKGSRREILDSDYSDVFEEVEEADEVEDEVEVEELNISVPPPIPAKGPSHYYSTTATAVRAPATGTGSVPLPLPTLKKGRTSDVSVTYSTDSFNSTDEPDAKVSSSYYDRNRNRDRDRERGNSNNNSTGSSPSSPSPSSPPRSKIPTAGTSPHSKFSPQESDFININASRRNPRSSCGPRSPTQGRKFYG